MLAKRLHLSTSTLHRYCIGTVVPAEFAPLDRLARVCRATPQEMTELHRRWILADGARRARPAQEAGGAAAAPGPVPVPVRVPDVTPGGAEEEPVTVGVTPPAGPVPWRGRRAVLVAAVATAAVLGVVALGLEPFGGDGKSGGAADQQPAGAAATAAPEAGQRQAVPDQSGRRAAGLRLPAGRQRVDPARGLSGPDPGASGALPHVSAAHTGAG
ncbi:helix-turn-helix domain-containing protein [Kitasatospora sp. NPDC091335]|uniref:helix-turn-helix domain-containing protein n=1 Tax=Kitasatospora sp. NPDC091335 TaxID=3364085 RepID=UPI003819ACF8